MGKYVKNDLVYQTKNEVFLTSGSPIHQEDLDKILELKPSSFRWKVREQQDDIGLIAQEVEPIIPMIVKDSISIGRTKEFLDGDTHKVIDYAKMSNCIQIILNFYIFVFPFGFSNCKFS